MLSSIKRYSRRVDDFGTAPATDLPTHVVDRDGATKASPVTKAAKRVTRTVVARILILFDGCSGVIIVIGMIMATEYARWIGRRCDEKR